MRRLLLTIATLTGFMPLLAQDCKSNIYMTNNAKMEMTIYDKKGKPSAVQTIQITQVKNNGGEFESTVTTSMADEKGKNISNGTGIYRCSNGLFSADMKMALPQEGLGNMNQAEAKVEPVYLEYPANMTVGQLLKDAEFKMDMTMKGGMATSLTFKAQNRKVAAKESVTSPAGTWEAYVISYDGNVKTKMAGIGLPGFDFTTKEWYVPGMGIVKSETYGKNGKLAGSTLLTSVSK